MLIISLMMLNELKIHFPGEDLWLPMNRTSSGLLLFAAQTCLFVFLII